MEVFQTIKALVTGDTTEKLKTALIDRGLILGWTNKAELEKSYCVNTMFKGTVLVLESPELPFNNKSMKGYLWLRSDNNSFLLFNIIPIKSRSLSYSEYNFILSKFYKDVIGPVTSKMGIECIVTNPERLIQDTLGKNIYELLLTFSESANKDTGNIHPFDFDRWSDFVIAVFRQNIKLSSDELTRWLEEDEGWDNEMATKLGIDYEYAIDILKKYEQSN